MSRSISLWLALLVLASCGRIGFGERGEQAPVDTTMPAPVVPPPPIFTNGARLHAEYFEVGAERQFATWFDTQLGEPCSAATAEDGVVRCLPSALTVGVQYSDPTCATPLVQAITPIDKTDCPSTDAHARQTINGRVRVIEPGAVYGGTVYQSTGPGSCVVVGSVGFPWLVVGATVPPATFVALHEELTRSGDLAYVEQVGEDGARQLRLDTLVVAATGEHARLVPTSHDTVALIPDLPVAGLVYGDAACTQRAAFVSGAATAGHAYVDDLHDTCTDALLDATLGAELSAFYQADGSGGCTMESIPAGYHAYAATIAPLIAVTTGTLAVPAGSGIVTASWAFTQGQTLPTSFYDVTHGDACAPVSAGSSNTRVCAPIWSGYPELYSDATCASPINGFPRCRGAWRAVWYPDAPLTWTCEGTGVQIVAYDQPTTGPYYAAIDQTCSLADAAQVAPLTQAHAEMDPATLTPVARRMD